MNWKAIATFLDNQSREFQNLANSNAVLKGRERETDRYDTLSQIARLLSDAITLGDR